MKITRSLYFLLLYLSVSSVAFPQGDSASSQAPEAGYYQNWLSQAFGISIQRHPDGTISAQAMDDLPERASSWYRRNSQLGKPLTSVPIQGSQHGDFILISLDFSEAWPDIDVAKRHVMYYLGEPTMYVLVRDEIKSPSQDIWTMQLAAPDKIVPINWDINFRDTDRRADLMAGVAGEFNPKIELNRPVSGYAKPSNGDQLLLARLLRNNDMAHKAADIMSPMNVRLQGGRKWLTTEVRSESPGIEFALVPYTHNQDELPMSILSQNALRLEWFDHSHRYTYFPQDDGSLEVMLTERSKSGSNQFGFGMDYLKADRPEGRLVAGYAFESLDNGIAKDSVGSFHAKVERGRLVDGLQAKSVYLGYPDRPERNHVAAGISIPEAIRSEFGNGHISVSFWYKSPMGQARNRPDNFAWPMGDAMRNRQYLDTGLFRVGHPHWQLDPATRGFNAAWQERAESGPLVPGKWNHLVFTAHDLDAEKFLYRYEVYINGVIRTSRELGPLTDLHRANRLHEFKGPIEVGNVWGTIDNLAIYNYPLGEDEILDLYVQQLEKLVSYYSCDQLQDGARVDSAPLGNYPEDQIIDNQWVPERTFAGIAQGAQLVPGVKGRALSLGSNGLQIPEKAMWDLSQGAFTIAYYFKYDGNGMGILNAPGLRLDVTRNKFHGAVGNQWEDRYLGHGEHELESGVWYHMALTYDRREMTMYLNGEELYRRPMASRDGINFSGTIRLGGGSSGGTIDEIYLYNFAIDQSTVKNLTTHLPLR